MAVLGYGSNYRVEEMIERLLLNEKASESLDFVDIREDTAQRLAEAVQANTTMHNLRLDFVKMVSQGYLLLAGALKINSTLQVLSLQGCEAQACKVIGGVSLENRTLQTVEIRISQIAYGRCDEGTCILYGDALRVNSTFGSLSLACMCITSAGCRLLSDGMKDNRTLQSLDLTGNKVVAQGCMALCDALQISHTLQKLDLGYNKIGAHGCRMLGEILAGGCSLRSLDRGTRRRVPFLWDAFWRASFAYSI